MATLFVDLWWEGGEACVCSGIHRDSRWLLCGSAMARGRGFLHLWRRIVRYGKTSARFAFPASETRHAASLQHFSCMMYDAIRMGKHPQIIHHPSNIIKTPFVLSSFQYFKIDFTYKENFLIIYIIKTISIEYFSIFKQLNDWKGERKDVVFSEPIYPPLFITSVEKFLIKKCQFFRQLANACLPLQPRNTNP